MFELGVTLASAALSVAVPNCDRLLGKYEEYRENFDEISKRFCYKTCGWIGQSAWHKRETLFREELAYNSSDQLALY